MRLEDALRALREEASAPSALAPKTRARVVAAFEKKRGPRSRRAIVLVPIAAVLAVATASAAGAGRFPPAWHSVARIFSSSRRPTASPSSIAPPPRSAPPVPPPDDPPAPPELPPPAAAAVVAPPPKAKVPRAISSVTPPPPEIDALDLYRNAHRLHFSSGDPAAALAAWDAYLREAPSGALALEARYNRALCLVRLERTEEARAALAPFAEGRFAGYRRAEARALLGVLDGEARSE